MKQRKEIIINRGLIRLCLFALMLLLPLGAWAQGGEMYNLGIVVGGVDVTNWNADNITGDNISGTVQYDNLTSTLTLDGATIAADGIVFQSSGNLKIAVSGECTVRGSISSTAASTLTFQLAESAPSGFLTYKPTYAGDATGFTSVTYDGMYLAPSYEEYGSQTSQRGVKYCPTRQRFEESEWQEVSTIAFTSDKNYELWVGGTKVTEENKGDVLGDASVTFNSDNNTLTLDGMTLNATGIYDSGIISRLDNLIISLNGDNRIISDDSCTAIRADIEGEQTLTIVKGGDNCSLTLKASRSIHDFSTLTVTGLSWNKDYIYRYDETLELSESAYRLMEADNKEAGLDYTNGTMPVLYDESMTVYDLWVAGKQVTSANATDIYAEVIDASQVSFDPTSNTLTLDLAYINMSDMWGFPAVSSGLPNLTINLVRDNSIYLNASCPYFVKYYGDAMAIAPQLTLATEGFMDDGLYWLGSLTLNGVSTTDALADGYTVSNTIDAMEFDAADVEPGSDYAYTLESGWKWYSDAGAAEASVKIFKFEVFDLWMDNARVLSSALRAGKAEGPLYNPVTQRLEFYENDITYPIKSSMPELVVEVYSTNSIIYNSDSEPVLFFEEKEGMAGAGEAGTLKVVLADGAEYNPENNLSIFNANGAAIKGFSSVTVESPLIRTTPATAPATWDENTHSFVISDLANLGIMLMKEGYSYTVTSKNRTNVLGEAEPSVQFDGEHTLVLNNASLTSINVSANPSFTTTGLTIWLKGENVIDNSEDAGGQPSAITFNGEKNIGLTFDTNEVEGGILMCSYDDSQTSLFPGFDAEYHKNLMPTVETSTKTVSISMLMNPIVTDENQDATREGDGLGLGQDIEGLGAEIIADYQVNNILYTLPGANDGCLQVDGKKVVALNTKMTDAQVNVIAQNIKDGVYLPGTPAFAAVFKGMTFLLPPGSGTMTFTVRTNGAGTLNVKVGTDEPTVITSTEGFAAFDVDYAVTEDTYVLIYNTADEVASAEGRPFAPGRKITNTTEMEKATIRPRSVRSSSPPSMEPKVLEKDAVAALVADGHLIIDDADLTVIADDAFEGLPDLTFVDLSKTGITGLFIDRTKAPFSALPKETFIYMPVGNDPAEGEQNVVIGTVCPDMVLADGDDAFEASFDFTAAKVTQARDYSGLLDKNCSVYLPFALDAETAASLGAFYELKSIDEGKVTMETVEATTANTPYMFKPAKEAISAKMVEVKTLTSAPSTGDARFIGTYAKTTICSTATEQYYCFVGSDDENAGKFVHVIDMPMEVNPFRAYIKIDGDALGRELLLDFGQGTTGIDTVTRQTLTGKMYNLQGREVRNVRGIVIVNGKKVMVK